MAKAFFRFLRGELNGYYITNIQAMCNKVSEEYKTFLQDFASQQMEKGKISAQTLDNLGKFAGIFLPRISKEEASTAIRLTDSEFDSELNYEFSERGLFKPEDEEFVFKQKVIDDTGLPDINTLSTPEQRSSLVGDEAVAGYIPDDEINVFDDNMHVDPAVIRPTPPSGQAYSDFYGDNFIFLSDSIPSYEPLTPEIFIELFKALQVIRYNGTSLASLSSVTEILCPEGLVKINTLTAGSNYWQLTYSIDTEVDVQNQLDRINMWEYVMRIKFPQLKVAEV